MIAKSLYSQLSFGKDLSIAFYSFFHSQPYFLSKSAKLTEAFPEEMDSQIFFRSDLENLLPKIVFEDS